MHPDTEAGTSARGAAAMEHEVSSSLDESHQEEEVKVLLVPYVCMHHLNQDAAQGEASASADASKGPSLMFLKGPGTVHDDCIGDSTLLLATQNMEDKNNCQRQVSESQASATSASEDFEEFHTDARQALCRREASVHSCDASSSMAPLLTHKRASAQFRAEKSDKEQDSFVTKALLPNEEEIQDGS